MRKELSAIYAMFIFPSHDFLGDLFINVISIIFTYVSQLQFSLLIDNDCSAHKTDKVTSYSSPLRK